MKKRKQTQSPKQPNSTKMTVEALPRQSPKRRTLSSAKKLVQTLCNRAGLTPEQLQSNLQRLANKSKLESVTYPSIPLASGLIILILNRHKAPFTGSHVVNFVVYDPKGVVPAVVDYAHDYQLEGELSKHGVVNAGQLAREIIGPFQPAKP